MIKIANKLEVLRGNKLLVPGCEPTSAFTSPTLAENRECKAAVVDLSDALKAIPGSTVTYMGNPRKKFFVLPSGPAEDPNVCKKPCKGIVEDWYALLRDIGTEVDVPTTTSSEHPASISTICEAFPLKGVF